MRHQLLVVNVVSLADCTFLSFVKHQARPAPRDAPAARRARSAPFPHRRRRAFSGGFFAYAERALGAPPRRRGRTEGPGSGSWPSPACSGTWAWTASSAAWRRSWMRRRSGSASSRTLGRRRPPLQARAAGAPLRAVRGTTGRRPAAGRAAGGDYSGDWGRPWHICSGGGEIRSGKSRVHWQEGAQQLSAATPQQQRSRGGEEGGGGGGGCCRVPPRHLQHLPRREAACR